MSVDCGGERILQNYRPMHSILISTQAEQCLFPAPLFDDAMNDLVPETKTRPTEV
jgi:hypothetical protein